MRQYVYCVILNWENVLVSIKDGTPSEPVGQLCLPRCSPSEVPQKALELCTSQLGVLNFSKTLNLLPPQKTKTSAGDLVYIWIYCVENLVEAAWVEATVKQTQKHAVSWESLESVRHGLSTDSPLATHPLFDAAADLFGLGRQAI